MIRNLLATTAVATLLATGALAQDNTQTTTQPAAPAATDTMPADANQAAATTQQADGHLASNLIGENVYNGTGDNAEKIGDVNDLVVGNDGNVESVVVGVGGFLGIGEKNVAIDWKEVSWADQDGDRFLVMETTKEQLEGLPDFDRSMYEPAPAATAADGTTAPADQTADAPGAATGTATTDQTATMPADQSTTADQSAQAPAADATAPADQTAEAPAADATAPADQTAEAPAADATAPADQTAQAPAAGTDQNADTDTMATAAIDKSTLTPLDTANIRSEELVGTTVYGANDENVGEIGDVVLTQDGKVDAIIVDVGGFLGMGEKEVALGMDNLSFLTDKDNNKYLYTNLTKEQLEAQAAYDESSWAQNRDQQRMSVQ